ncbi:MAG: hypothetical protein ACK4R8_02820 [Thiobacillus sp.]
MKTIHYLLLAGALSATNAFAEPYGDRVARCLAEQNVMPDAADFNQQAERCERILKMDDAKSAWQGCVSRAVALMDDRVSPASDIATATADQCGQEHGAMLDALTLSPETRYRLYSERKKATKELAIKLILMQRAEANRRQQAAPAPSPKE